MPRCIARITRRILFSRSPRARNYLRRILFIFAVSLQVELGEGGRPVPLPSFGMVDLESSTLWKMDFIGIHRDRRSLQYASVKVFEAGICIDPNVSMQILSSRSARKIISERKIAHKCRRKRIRFFRISISEKWYLKRLSLRGNIRAFFFGANVGMAQARTECVKSAAIWSGNFTPLRWSNSTKMGSEERGTIWEMLFREVRGFAFTVMPLRSLPL